MPRPLQWVLALLKVPPEPRPPFGDPATLRVFRAGRNYYRLRLAGWGVAQVVALAALLFWTAILVGVEQATVAEAQNHSVPEELLQESGPSEAAPMTADHDAAEPSHRKDIIERFVEIVTSVTEHVAPPGRPRPDSIGEWIEGYRQFFVELALQLPSWVFPLIWVIKVFSFAAFVVQLPITYALRRLDYEMRWYMVTDRSLRLRHGIWKVAESTMSFANLQQVVVTQGPLQRLLGLANVKVQSAGGGSGRPHNQQKADDDMHVGWFRHVTNATEIRDLILERLRRFRESGLGDPEEQRSAGAALPVSAPSLPAQGAAAETVAAARELLAEARALRATLS